MSAYSTKRVSALESQWIGEKGLSMQRVKQSDIAESNTLVFPQTVDIGVKIEYQRELYRESRA